MKYEVKIEYRDDKSKVFECMDVPSVGDRWLVLYLADSSRRVIPCETIQEINYRVKK